MIDYKQEGFIACDSEICKYCALYYSEDADDKRDCNMCDPITKDAFIGIECVRTLTDEGE